MTKNTGSKTAASPTRSTRASTRPEQAFIAAPEMMDFPDERQRPARPTKKCRKPSGYRRVYLRQVAALQKAKAIIEEVMKLRSTGFTEWFALCDIAGAIDRMMSEYEHWDYTSGEIAYLRRYYPEELHDPNAKPKRYAPDS